MIDAIGILQDSTSRTLSRGVSDVSYNVLNLPQRVEFADGGRIDYLYSASGTKLAETVYDAAGSLLSRRDYVGQFEFVADTLERTLLPEGFVTAGDNVFHAYIPDYQGNIVGVYNSSTNTLQQFPDYYPYGLPHATSTAPPAHRRKYGAKALTADLGLNLYAFAARFQNPAFPAFTTPDPLAESYYPTSPYAYCSGDPVNLVDPSGMDIYRFNEDGELVERIENTEFDRVDIVDKDGKPVLDDDGDAVSYSFIYGTIKTQDSFDTTSGVHIDFFIVNDKQKAFVLFEFLSNNICNKHGAPEFALMNTIDRSGDYAGFISTSHEENAEWGATQLMHTGRLRGYKIYEHFHSHPSSPTPSKADFKVKEYMNSEQEKTIRRSILIKYSIYFVPERTYYKY